MKGRGKHYTTWNIPRCITFSTLHFMLYCGKLISFIGECARNMIRNLSSYRDKHNDLLTEGIEMLSNAELGTGTFFALSRWLHLAQSPKKYRNSKQREKSANSRFLKLSSGGGSESPSRHGLTSTYICIVCRGEVRGDSWARLSTRPIAWIVSFIFATKNAQIVKAR